MCVVFVLLSYFADVFNSSMWMNFREAVAQNDVALSTLAESLPGVVLASRAPSTSAEYTASYNRWKSWARSHSLIAFLASPFEFALYLRFSMIDAKTVSPLESAVHSIAWMHQLGGEPSPSDHPLVKNVLAGAQPAYAGPSHFQEGANYYIFLSLNI